MEFSRRAPRLLQHGRIEQQRNARDEGSLLFRRLSLACEPSPAISCRALKSEYNARSRRNCLRSSPFQFCARARAASSSRKKASMASFSSLLEFALLFLAEKIAATLRALPQSWPARSRGQSFPPVPGRARARPEFRGGRIRPHRRPQSDRPRGRARAPRACCSRARCRRSETVCVRVPWRKS